MSQIALRLVDSHPRRRSVSAQPARDPRDLSDDELLEHFLPGAGAIIAYAAGLRGALELPFEQLARFPAANAERHATVRFALELGRRYAQAPINRGAPLESPAATRRALMSRLRDLEHEVFVCLFLTVRHHIISCEEMFRGTIDGSSVHVREVVKRALALNAAAVVFAHNHPSGVAEPSRSDRAITSRLIEALRLVDIRVLDHFVIGDGDTVSFAERGWI